MNYFTLETVLTAVECGRLLEAAKSTKGRSGRILDAELLWRVAAGRVQRAIGEWREPAMGGTEVCLESLEVHPTKTHGAYYRVEAAHCEAVCFTWCPQQRNVMVGQGYRVLAATEGEEVLAA